MRTKLISAFCFLTLSVCPARGQELQGHVIRVSDGMLFISLKDSARVRPGDRFQIVNGAVAEGSPGISNGIYRMGIAQIVAGSRRFARAELVLDPGITHAALMDVRESLRVFTLAPDPVSMVPEPASYTVGPAPKVELFSRGLSMPRVQASRTSTPPKIDGRLDDAVWQSAMSIDDFLQREPFEGDPATEKTEVRILVDDDRIYLGFRCYDSEPNRIVASRMQRDSQLNDDDNVSVIFDTYNDRRGGFYFRTNPLGAQYDMLLSDEGRTRNEAWDCIWQTRSSRDAEGWSAEMAIDLDQLRYAESEDAIWGLNLGRTIKRKNEEIFLMPPPLDYGFRGQYRTSMLGTLGGIGALRTKPRFQVTPFTLGGTNREFDGLDPTEQPTLEAGVDLKYGLTPSLTLDLSYKTDFAQVEADQEQVNLTRFSLFFPELRDFFLEGAGIFDFGETIEFRGGSNSRPPTLVFYSRKIGIQDGQNIPVVFGGKVTGRAGSYEIGALNVMTEAGTFVDEDTEDRFITLAGDSLDKDEAKLFSEPFADTIDVDVMDTLNVDRTNLSVMRVRRDIFGRSNIGFIGTNRSPGEEDNYNRVVGGDLNLSFFGSALKLKGWFAKSWTPGKLEKDLAHNAEVEFRKYNLQLEAKYLDVQKNFNPEIGFVPRDDIRRYNVETRWRPRFRNLPAIRQFSFGPEYTYLTDQNNLLQSSKLRASFFTNLKSDDWIGFRFERRFERLDDVFDVSDDVDIPIGDYAFTSYSVNLFSNGARAIGGRVSYSFGDFFDGTRNRISAGGDIKLTDQFTIETNYSNNRVSLPGGKFQTNQLTNRFLYTFNPDFFVRGLVQWNSRREVVGSNFLLNYRFAPGSDIFLVYNHAWDTATDFAQLNRSVQLKVAYFWKK